MNKSNITKLIGILVGIMASVSVAAASVIIVDFDTPLKNTNAGAEGFLGTGGAGYDYNGNFGTWLYNGGNMGIDDPAEGDASGGSSGNAISSIGMARVQDWRGSNARAISVIFESTLFTDGVEYTVSFDVIGDASGNDAGRYWLAEVSGYDNSGSNYIQIDGTWNGWGNLANKPFTANGTADVTYLADSESNGVLLTGEDVAGITNTSFNFTYSAGTDIAFAAGTFNNIYGVDNFTITAVPEPETFALLAGIATLGLVIYRRRRF